MNRRLWWWFLGRVAFPCMCAVNENTEKNLRYHYLSKDIDREYDRKSEEWMKILSFIHQSPSSTTVRSIILFLKGLHFEFQISRGLSKKNPRESNFDPETESYVVRITFSRSLSAKKSGLSMEKTDLVWEKSIQHTKSGHASPALWVVRVRTNALL